MADAAVGKTELFKGIRWYDGFVVALANPGFLIGSLGYSIGALVAGERRYCGRSRCLWVSARLDLRRDGVDVSR